MPKNNRQIVKKTVEQLSQEVAHLKKMQKPYVLSRPPSTPVTQNLFPGFTKRVRIEYGFATGTAVPFTPSSVYSAEVADRGVSVTGGLYWTYFYIHQMDVWGPIKSPVYSVMYLNWGSAVGSGSTISPASSDESDGVMDRPRARFTPGVFNASRAFGSGDTGSVLVEIEAASTTGTYVLDFIVTFH